MSQQLTVNLALKTGSAKEQIKSINNEVKVMKSEFDRTISTVDEFSDGNEQLTAKLKLSRGMLEQTEKKLAIYKNELIKSTEALDKSNKKYTDNEKKVASLKKELEEATKTYGKSSDEVKQLEQALKKQEQALESSRKQVLNADNSFKNMNTTVNKTEAEVNKLKSEINNLDNELNNIDGDSVKQLGNDMDETTNKGKNLGASTVIIGEGIANLGEKASEAGKKLLDMYVNSAEAGMEYEASINGTAFLMDGLAQSTQDLINANSENANALGMTNKQYLDSAVQLANYQKTMGFTTSEIDSMSASTIQMVADLGAVKDVPFDEAMKAYQSGLKGNYEAMDLLNVSLSANTLENTDYIQSLDKSWSSLSEVEKMTGIYLETQRQAGSSNGLAAQEAGETGMQYKLMKEEMKDLTGTIGTQLLPALAPIIESFREIITKTVEWVKENPKLTAVIMGVVGGIGALLTILGAVLVPIGLVTVAIVGVNLAGLPIILTIGGIVLAITALIAIIGIVILKWDEIKQCWSNFTAWASELWEKCKTEWIAKWNESVEGVKTLASNMVESVKTKWNNFTSWCSNLWNKLVSDTKQKWNEFVQGAKDFGSKVVESVKNAFSKVYDFITYPFVKAWEFISSIGSKIGGMISSIFGGKNRMAVEYDMPPTPPIPQVAKMPNLENVAKSGSYYNAKTVKSRALNSTIQQSSRPVTPTIDMQGMFSKFANMMVQAMQNVNVQNSFSVELDSKDIGKVVYKDVKNSFNKETNNRRKTGGR